ncbi:MAG: carboxypeptidase-like regulatory domain-containing protein [Acidobacteriota bacterium]|nr:carboxypeptidase-like regulatory domain-containing protein [Acidobacteriota bacterium]MDH3530535.1 carboxypeptidase-like regulatory domain-containing protein [Acidobacteriota bacterium]
MTAAKVSVGGKVERSAGSGIRNAVVMVTDPSGQIGSTGTNQFGYFNFEGIEAGGTYVFAVHAKGYSFSQRALNITDDKKGLVLTAK